MEAEGYTNQCSVHYSYLENGKGGHNGSNTFGVISGAGPALLTFAQEGVERVIDHCYMTNSTYAYLSMCKGDAYAKKHNLTDGDWFKVTVTGLSKEGETTGTVDFYLSDFRSPLTAKVVSIWTKVDLSSLGAVHQLSFSFDSSDKGEWGLNTPTYCCIDDVAVKVQ